MSYRVLRLQKSKLFVIHKNCSFDYYCILLYSIGNDAVYNHFLLFHRAIALLTVNDNALKEVNLEMQVELLNYLSNKDRRYMAQNFLFIIFTYQEMFIILVH